MRQVIKCRDRLQQLGFRRRNVYGDAPRAPGRELMGKGIGSTNVFRKCAATSCLHTHENLTKLDEPCLEVVDTPALLETEPARDLKLTCTQKNAGRGRRGLEPGYGEDALVCMERAWTCRARRARRCKVVPVLV